MLSEERIRVEVHRVANTIDVDVDTHLAAVLAGTPNHGRARPTRAGSVRRWRPLVPLAAAAAVVGVVVAGATLRDVFPDGESGDDQAAPVVLAGTPDGTVPSVFGHTRESASSLLREAGLEVRYGEQVSCDPEGRPVGTEPATGAPVQPGDTVTLLLSFQAANTDCYADLTEPWRFVDFATGRGPSPGFADEVRLFVDGERAGTLSGEEAARGDWGEGSALSILRRASEEVLRVGDTYRMPWLGVTTSTPPDVWCGVARPRAVADREALILTVDFEEETGRPRCPARVALYETGGAIDTVIAWSPGARAGAQPPIPDVVGLGLTEARDAVTAAGYPVRVEELETCHPRDGVVEQAPTQQVVEQDAADEPGWYGPVTLVVEVPHTTRDCVALDTAASDFLRFARGGAPPAWAPEVQQLLGYTPWATASAERAGDPTAWSFCSGVAPEDCEVSPLVVAGRDVEVATGEFSDVTRWPGDQVCEMIDRGGLPRGLPVERQIVLYPKELASCDDDWSVWLWIDEEGRISTVNLLVPESTSSQ